MTRMFDDRSYNVGCTCSPALGAASRRRFLRGAATIALCSVRSGDAAWAQVVKAGGTLDHDLLLDLVHANHILAAKGVLDSYGHVSVRDPHDPTRFWMSCAKAPVQVTVEDVMEYDLDCNPIDPRGRPSFYERWIHGEVYKVRPEVMSIVHSHSPTVIPFSATKIAMRPLIQMAAFLARGVPIYDSRPLKPDSDLMIGEQSLGREMAMTLGPSAKVVLLRGHGDVVVGETIRIAVFRAYYTEENAKGQEQAVALGGRDVTYLSVSESEAAEKLTESPASVNRAWDSWLAEIEH